MIGEELSSRQKVKVVLEGMENDISEVCSEYNISKAEFEQWRKKLLNSADAVFNSQVNEEELKRITRKTMRRYRLTTKR